MVRSGKGFERFLIFVTKIRAVESWDHFMKNSLVTREEANDHHQPTALLQNFMKNLLNPSEIKFNFD